MIHEAYVISASPIYYLRFRSFNMNIAGQQLDNSPGFKHELSNC